MHRIVKKTLQYTGFLFLSLIVLLIAGISYLYFSADMQTPKHEQSMTTDKVIDIDSLHLRHYGDNFLRHSDSGLWELFVKGDAFQRGEAIGQLSSDLLHHQEKVFVDQIREIVPSDSYLKFLRFFIVLFNRNLGENVLEEYRDEIYGISLSCTHEYDFIGTPYERQLNYHSAHDLGHAMQDYMLVGCSSFATWGTQSADSSLLIGRNFDFYVGDAFAENKQVAFYVPEQGYRFASVGWPGMIGVLSGMNETGLTVTINAAKSAHAAQGYARVSGDVGVCLVTSGPGATNTVTGIADAMIDSTPIVVIAGQVGTGFLGTDAFQEVDLVGITQPITKWSYQIRRAEDVAWAVARAFYIAHSGRPGPVVLDFAKNAQVEKTKYEPTKVDFIRSYVPVPDTDEETVQAAAELINNAERPLVLVGQGVELGNAQSELREFIEKADMPAGCTLLGLSALPTEHPLNKGMLGMHGNLGPNINTNKCDVLIAVGMRFDDRVTGNLATYAKQAKVIHFDIDPAEVNKNVKVDVAVLGDCKETLASVTKLLKKNTHTEWIDSFKEYEKVEEEKVIRPELHPATNSLSMGEVVRAVSDATHHEAVLVTDVGQNQMISARYFKYTKERSIITSGGLGTMGFGLPAAIGATFGAPERTVCVFMGDGGLQMNIQELGTIMEQKAPVKIICLNNNYLGNVRQWQAMFFNRRYSFTPMLNPDYMKVASAYDIPSKRVFTREELKEAIAEMLATDGPFLLEACVVEEGNVLPMTPPGGSVNQMLLEC